MGCNNLRHTPAFTALARPDRSGYTWNHALFFTATLDRPTPVLLLLLHRWEPRRSDPDVKGRDLVSRLKDPHGIRDDEMPNLKEADDLRSVLHEVAFTTHRDAPAGESRGVIDGDRLFRTLKRFFSQTHRCDEGRAFSKAQLFLMALKEEAGLLVPCDEQTYQFPHLTFQEYLAACHLAEHDEAEREAYACWAGSDGDRWREVILLMMGCLRRQRNGMRVGRPWLTDWLLDPRRPKSPAQAQRDALLALDCYRALGGRAALTHQSDLIEQGLRGTLAALLDPGAPHLPAADRVRAGVALGELGDPRPGVCDLPLPFVAFTGGSFGMGLTQEEYQQIIEEERANGLADQAKDWFEPSLNQQPVSVAPFALARYPVTNGQYRRFIDAGGYDPAAPWWSEAGRAWLKRGKNQPELWDDARFGIARPNHPVVGVNWYEATAFCDWLTQELNDGFVYSLPSEAEWEYAARGPARRIYPWGDPTPDGERANFNVTHRGTTAVGCFPAGATPEGLLDMAGNVWEWTGSEFHAYPYDSQDGREDGSDPAQKRFTLRGASWFVLPFDLRATDRYHLTPDYRDYYLGLRLARQSA